MDESYPDRALEEADRCVKCGLCLPHCPTYRLYADENESPRGRIALAEALLRGQLSGGEKLANHLYRCLLCRRCERACPSGVRYAHLMDAARARIPRPHWTSRLVQHPGLSRTLNRLAHLAPLPGNTLSALGRALPTQAPPAPGLYTPGGTPRGRVGLLLGCVTRSHQGNALTAARHLLNRLGYEVSIPPAQGCCGALALHQGAPQTADQQALVNKEAFRGVDRVIAVASGCAAHLREALAGLHCMEILQFLQADPDLPRLVFAPLDAVVALHRPCSAVNVLGGDAAAALLGRIPGLRVQAIGQAGDCCGAAGDHLLTHRQQALALRQPLLDELGTLRPDYLCSCNVGCALHLAEGMHSQGIRLQTLHPVELLAQQLESPPAADPAGLG